MQLSSEQTENKLLYDLDYGQWSSHTGERYVGPKPEYAKLGLGGEDITTDMPSSWPDLNEEGSPTLTEATPATLLYRDIASALTAGRCMFVTTKGLVGVADAKIKPGDTVSVLKGARMPFILRASEAGPGHRLVSEAFVRAIMHGESLRGTDAYEDMAIE